MNKSDIVFISGLSVPTFLAKTKYVWNDKMWLDYNRAYISNYIPTSDLDAIKKIDTLKNMLATLNEPVIIGQSLGAWWAANLACTVGCNIKKIILMTPLVDVNKLYLFNTSSLLSPLKQTPIVKGPHRVLVCHAKYDLLCPPLNNSWHLVRHFNAVDYSMEGGHFFQSDHISALKFMQDWIDI